MKFAMFQTPFMRPERTPRQVFDFAVDQAIECDRLGFTEYWIGEHATMSWESITSPELVIAASARQTQDIKLCPGAHLLPYHNPATLATQVAWMTHVTEGRYILGIGSGGYPSDAKLRGYKDMSTNHKRTTEALEIMNKVWESKPFQFDGEFYSAGYPENDEHHEYRSTAPYGGKVEIGLAGLSPNSPSLSFAGRNGYNALSVYAGEAAIANHWNTYEKAANEAGITVDRDNFRVVRDIIVADTDAEARKLAVEGGIGKAWMEYLVPVYKQFGLLQAMLPDMDMADVTIDDIVEKVWIVGSPDTVAEKLNSVCEATGGWGTTLVYGHDYLDDVKPWNYSLQLLTEEVAPKLG
ncbi:LLM class flavin-dependent oxidoreductase [Rhodococcus sp. T7]|uniref:LLM class flavin-dependent oxidoreductase n=1 Tax=Rhodococcus sp. T7 TaxID=627444 RepID=UPI0013595F4E|nr:LLM class flavin-dependent oxidoreductase [Rhodococcus sp. T7]